MIIRYNLNQLYQRSCDKAAADNLICNRNLELTLNEFRLFTLSRWVGDLMSKRPVLFCLVKRLPHRKEFRRKKLE